VFGTGDEGGEDACSVVSELADEAVSWRADDVGGDVVVEVPG
jgi:hypothetical protein